MPSKDENPEIENLKEAITEYLATYGKLPTQNPLFGMDPCRICLLAAVLLAFGTSALQLF